ncbi:MAG: response regulator transcription factor [Blastocatellia bacterium]|nr:response regulator transcription factor [Blastocatellia bacterium]
MRIEAATRKREAKELLPPDGKATATSLEKLAAPLLPAQNRLRLFIADDSQLILDNLSALLQLVPGIQIVGTAQTTKAAIQGIQRLTPDLVILDFQLSDGNGLDVLKVIKHQDTGPTVIMFTNHVYPPYREHCTQWGADHFFDKSQDVERVVETCQQLLSLK